MMGVMTGKGTKRRSIRVPDEEWEPFVEKAKLEGTDASTKIRHFIRANTQGDADAVADLAACMAAAVEGIRLYATEGGTIRAALKGGDDER